MFTINYLTFWSAMINRKNLIVTSTDFTISPGERERGSTSKSLNRFKFLGPHCRTAKAGFQNSLSWLVLEVGEILRNKISMSIKSRSLETLNLKLFRYIPILNFANRLQHLMIEFSASTVIFHIHETREFRSPRPRKQKSVPWIVYMLRDAF